MIDHDRALEILEREEQEVPFCDCGARTVPVARDGALWIECSLLGRPRSGLRRVLVRNLAAQHTRRPIMELSG